MKLQEKILYLRKKSGYSQEAVAEKLGVSRQAVSKWENGDADPEIGKLRLLAQLFQVSTDWLLSEDEPMEKEAEQVPRTAANYQQTQWIENAPGLIGKLIKRFGWLLGVYIAFTGTLFTGMGMLARFMTRRMFSSVFQNPYGEVFGMDDPFTSIIANNPVTLLGTIIMYLGIIMIISGIILAVILKRMGSKSLDQ